MVLDELVDVTLTQKITHNCIGYATYHNAFFVLSENWYKSCFIYKNAPKKCAILTSKIDQLIIKLV